MATKDLKITYINPYGKMEDTFFEDITDIYLDDQDFLAFYQGTDKMPVFMVNREMVLTVVDINYPYPQVDYEQET